MKLKLNEKAIARFATELRRASWGLGVTAATTGLKLNSILLWVMGASGWLLFQLFAFIIESITED